MAAPAETTEGLFPKPFMRKVTERICIAQNVNGFSTTKKFHCFQSQALIQYHGYCDDFGPFNIASVCSFIRALEHELESHPTRTIVHCVDSGTRQLTNAVFLLGAFMLLKYNSTSENVEDCFNWLEDDMIENFRDATYAPSSFGLTLQDCWKGLEKGIALGWVEYGGSSPQWGQTNIDEYAHFDCPLNADMHVVVPGKFIAFKGPRDLGGLSYFDDADGNRDFGPHHYAALFRDLGVTDVVRLNEPEYGLEAFAAAGLRHHDLAFDDCTPPPPAVVARFFRVADAAGGLIAVHCRAGLGRTGTLIALHMMRTHGFAPREAIAWLRLMRPGCVIGKQQHFLCDTVAAAASAPPPAPASERPPTVPEELAGQVAAGMAHRCAAATAAATAAAATTATATVTAATDSRHCLAAGRETVEGASGSKPVPTVGPVVGRRASRLVGPEPEADGALDLVL